MAERWWIARRDLPDGRCVAVIPLTFGRARIIVGRGDVSVDDAW